MDADLVLNLAATRAGLCVECGKCSSVCPMAEMYPDFGYPLSPRGLVQSALRGLGAVSARGLWCCTGCGECSRTCPAGVDCAGLIAALKPLIPGPAGGEAVCRDCGAALPPPAVLDYLRKVLAGPRLDWLWLCPACRRRAYAGNNA